MIPGHGPSTTAAGSAPADRKGADAPDAARGTDGTPGTSGADDAHGTARPARAEHTEHTPSEAVLAEIERAVVGKREALELIWAGVLAGGHVLIEDLPGVGKTLIARSFAAVLGLRFTRVQFTPDLLPADLTGATVYDQVDNRFVFRPGPVFTNVLLADEINRTPPKTQAALLEAMAELQVSIDGQTRPLEAPFVVLATENPIEYEGTYPLPEAQLDRFSLRVRLGYLAAEAEVSMLQRRLDRGAAAAVLAEVLDRPGLLALREAVERVTVHPDVLGYVVAIADATRRHPQIQVGASPRACLDLVQLARARALIGGRDFVLPQDVKQLATPALAHRLSLRPELWVRRVSAEQVLAGVLEQVPAPRVPSPGTGPGAHPAARPGAGASVDPSAGPNAGLGAEPGSGRGVPG